MDAEVSTHTFLTMIIEESVCFMSLSGNFISPCYQSILNDTEVRKIYRLEEAKVSGPRTEIYMGASTSKFNNFQNHDYLFIKLKD
jgi:hypothetical protein